MRCVPLPRMSLFRIALRSITQRRVASLLTMLSMAPGRDAGRGGACRSTASSTQSFANNASLGYNMLVGAKGGKEQLVSQHRLLPEPAGRKHSVHLLPANSCSATDRDRLLQQSYCSSLRARG